MAEPSAKPDPFNWRPVHAVVVLLVVAGFLFSVRAVLNPFILFVLLVFMLAPFRGTRFHLLLVSAAGTLTLIWMLESTGSLLAPFLLALGLAYVQQPLVSRMQRPWVPRRFLNEHGQGPTLSRGLAVTMLTLPALLLVALVAFVGIPALTEQVTDFIRGVPQLVQRASVWAQQMQVRLATRDYPLVDERAVLGRIQQLDPQQVMAMLEARQAELARRAWGAVLGVGRGLGALLNIVGYVFLTPILTFYLLRDWDRLTARMGELIPRTHRQRVVGFAQEYDRLLSSYLRGQFTESAIVGVLTWLMFWLWGFPYAMLMGVIAGVFNVVPYMGLVATAIPALLVALFTPDPVYSLIKVAVVFTVVQVLDGSVLGPKIVGDSVGLHPVWVILALAVFGYFFGFVGLLLAVPLAVLVKLLLERGLARYQESALYRGGPAPAAD